MVTQKRLIASHNLTFCRYFSPSVQPPVCTPLPHSELSSPIGLSAARCRTFSAPPFLTTLCFLKDTTETIRNVSLMTLDWISTMHFLCSHLVGHTIFVHLWLQTLSISPPNVLYISRQYCYDVLSWP